MKVQKVTDSSFSKYGKVLSGYGFEKLLDTLRKCSEKPSCGTIYVPSDETLEACEVYAELRDRAYGGMPIQIGYCNGSNQRLNCLEYHRDSEVDIAADDVILLLGRQDEIQDGTYDTSKVEAFLLPAGVAVELYATTLHYAPCNGEGKDGFRVIIVLPRGTNTEMPQFTAGCEEDRWMTARNKWLLAHPDAPEAQNGAHVGLIGENISI